MAGWLRWLDGCMVGLIVMAEDILVDGVDLQSWMVVVVWIALMAGLVETA